jgi:hypothetical protein
MTATRPEPRTVPLDSRQLDAAIALVAGVAVQTRPSRGELWRYRALMVLTDGVLLGLLALFLLSALDPGEQFLWLLGLVGIALGLCLVSALALLVLNLPLIWRTAVERRRLLGIGVLSLSDALWQASRRSRWIDRLRSLVALVLSVLLALSALFGMLGSRLESGGAAPASGLGTDLLVFGVMAGGALLLLVTRHLRLRREQLDLAADAGGLAAALQHLRGSGGGDHRMVAVPEQLLARVAGIEAAQIVQSRQRALAESVGARTRAWRIVFEGAAIAQRTALASADRMALDDLVADLSADGVPAAAAGDDATRQLGCGTLRLTAAVDAADRCIRVRDIAHPSADGPPGEPGTVASALATGTEHGPR